MFIKECLADISSRSKTFEILCYFQDFDVNLCYLLCACHHVLTWLDYPDLCRWLGFHVF